MAICQSCANPSNSSTNSCSCGCNPPTPAASTTCEVCADLSAMDCVYYKGTITNNLNLGTNFRLKTFVEAALPILSSINTNTTDTYINSIAIAAQSTKGSFQLTSAYNANPPSVTAGPNASFNVSSHYAISKINEQTGTALTADQDFQLNLLDSIPSNQDTINTTDDYLGVLNTTNSRAGYRKVSTQLFFTVGSAATITLSIKYFNTTTTTVVHTETISCLANTPYKVNSVLFLDMVKGGNVKLFIKSSVTNTVTILSTASNYFSIEELY